MPDLPGSSLPAGGDGSSRPVRIAVDAMGGDGAPAIEVEGAVEAALEAGDDLEIVLVGRKDALEAELARHNDAGNVSIVHASDAVEMHEPPANAVRRKRDSSIVVATGLHKRGDVDGLVSAGNTGAVVASGLLGLGMLENVRRPAIASSYPTSRLPGVLLDVGASVDTKPGDILRFAAMGETYVEHLLGREKPRVGLLNIGEEPSKGSELTQAAHALLADSPLNFVGNVEGNALLRGDADVVVCDGFVGNIVLKFMEGVLHFVAPMMSGSGGQDGPGAALVRQLDYAEYGGAPLLGVGGVVIIAHGSSSPKAIKNAVKVAARFVRTDLDGMIVNRIREVVTSDGR